MCRSGLRAVASYSPVFVSESSVSTTAIKASEIERRWHVVDAQGLVLGRLATEVANILRGKHKATYTPHLDTGDHVIIVNADKIVLTGGKAEKKIVYTHSGYPGGISAETYGHKLSRKPEQAVLDSIRGMIPKTRLGRAQIKKLKVYAGPTHPHEAQKPQPLEIAHAVARDQAQQGQS